MEIVKLNLIPNGVNPVCHVSQYDKGRQIRFNLFSGLEPYTLQSGDSVALNLRKPDNTIITASVTATQGNDYVIITTTEQMTAVKGEVLGELKITNGVTVIGTLNFIMLVERDVVANGDPSESVIKDLGYLIDEAIGDNYYNKEETNELIDDKLGDSYPMGEASGAIASFNTDVVLPLKSCECYINPTQAGSGDPSPSNAREISGYTGANVGETGKNYWIYGDVIVSNYNKSVYLFTPLPAGTYTLSLNVTSTDTDTNTCLAIVYLETGQAQTLFTRGVRRSFTFTATSKVTRIAFYASDNYSHGAGDTAIWSDIQLEAGNTATNYDSKGKITFVDWGVNQWDETWEVGDINSSTGQNTPDSTLIRSTGYIEVKPNTSYFFHSDSGSFKYMVYDKNKQYVDYFIRSKNSIQTMGSNIYYIRFVMISDYGNVYKNNISINYPATLTDYYKYVTGQTIYGGKINVATGELIVDRAKTTINDCISNRTTSYANPVFYGSISGLKPQTSNIICDKFKVIAGQASASTFATNSNNNEFAINSANAGATIQVFLRCDDYTDVASLKAALGTSEVVFELANPIIYKIDPVIIKTLLGQNNIFHDCNGDIDVIYRHALTARNIYFDNAGTTLTSDNVEAAIKELLGLIQ